MRKDVGHVTARFGARVMRVTRAGDDESGEDTGGVTVRLCGDSDSRYIHAGGAETLDSRYIHAGGAETLDSRYMHAGGAETQTETLVFHDSDTDE